MSMSTIFSSASPTSQEVDAHENSTLAAFVAHIDRLQDQVREKDVHITDLEEDRMLLQQRHSQLEQIYNKLALHSEIQSDLLRKTRRTDTHVERLRTAIVDRETMIVEKDKTILAVERQLEYHKLLLQAEIRRNAVIKLHLAADDDPLPDLASLAKREDIDRWMSKLNQKLKKEHPSSETGVADTPQAQMDILLQEIDFYVHEIIYFKLDIKGYKSDIRKLKKITAQLGDIDSEASSLRPIATPTFSAYTTPEFGASSTTSPIQDGLAVIPTSCERSITPTPSARVRVPECITASSTNRIEKGAPHPLDIDISTTSRITTHEAGIGMANEADHVDSGISPGTVAPLSSEHRRPMVCASAV
jgi:hypothetical protein